MNWRLIPRREGFCSSVPKLVERRGRTATPIWPSSVHFSEATATAYFSENRDAAADAWSSAKILYDPDGSLARVRDQVAAIVARGKPPLDAIAPISPDLHGVLTRIFCADDSTTEKLRLAHLVLPLVFDRSA
jgi:hypothetical protein